MSPSTYELKEAASELRPAELQLLFHYYHLATIKASVEDYENSAIQEALNFNESTLRNAKSALKKKGYAQLVKFKDEHGEDCLRVILGKDQVRLYELGIKDQITDPLLFKQLARKIDLFNPTLTSQEVQHRLQQIKDEAAELQKHVI